MEVNRTKLRNEYISVGTEYWKDLNDKPNLSYVIWLEDKNQFQQEEIERLRERVKELEEWIKFEVDKKPLTTVYDLRDEMKQLLNK